MATTLTDAKSPLDGAPPLDGDRPVEDVVAPGTSSATRSLAASTWALFFGMGLLMMGNGLQGTLLGLRAEAAGFSVAVSGLVMTAYFVGFMIGSPLAAKLLTTVGHIRVFAALASGASSAVLVFAVATNPISWALMRFAFGLCIAGLYVVAESWLNDLATNATRGRMLSVYQVVVLGGMSLGQVLLNMADTNGAVLFIVASVMVSMSLIPITLSATTNAPPIRVPEPMSTAALIRVVPTGVFISFSIGAALGILMGMGAVYASARGLSTTEVGLFMAAPMIGSLVLQWPIGYLSDRVPRRGVIFATAVGATLVSLLLVTLPAGSTASFGAMFLLGGLSFPLYSLGLAYTNDWLPAEKVIGASSTLIRINAGGAIVGPLVTSMLMAAFGEASFYWALFAGHAAIAVYVGWRLIAKDAPPKAHKSKFVVFPTRGGVQMAPLLRPIRRPRSRATKPQSSLSRSGVSGTTP